MTVLIGPRTHRERKQKYVKSLEEEVLQLRNLDILRLQEVKNLYAEITRLKELLAPYTQMSISDDPISAHITEDGSPSSIRHGIASIRKNSFKKQQIFLRQDDENYQGSNLHTISGSDISLDSSTDRRAAGILKRLAPKSSSSLTSKMSQEELRVSLDGMRG
jgi:hypothetical protein